MLLWECVLYIQLFNIFDTVLTITTAGHLCKTFIHLRNTSRATIGRNKAAERASCPSDELWRSEFPALNSTDFHDLIYLDNAATTQKPQSVIEAINSYYSTPCSNVHRSQHPLATTASIKYERGRENITRFLGAKDPCEIVFTSGATDAINLVASAWCPKEVGPRDVILLPLSEHNSNIIPWQLHSERSGCDVRFIKLNADGSIDLDDYKSQLVNGRVKLVALGHASNVLGHVQNLKDIIRIAHEHGAKVLVDACQTLAHIPVDVHTLDCDFLVGSAHKMYGPTGLGFLYAKRSILESMHPCKGGGGMVKTVTSTGYNLDDIPHRFEPGTPPVAQVVGFSAAIDFLRNIGLDKIAAHERDLLIHLHNKLRGLATVHSHSKNIGDTEHCPIVSFNVEGVSPFDLAALLSLRNVAVRAVNGGDSILRVDPKLVPTKHVGKALRRVGAMGTDRCKIERILLTCATQMGHAMDDVNVCTYLNVMVKLRISNAHCLERIVPYCYNIKDMKRAIACCHLISMVPGSRNVTICRAFMVQVAQRIPLDGYSIEFPDLGRLCESLRSFDLYCEELGRFLISLIETELEPSESTDGVVYMSSILSYIGGMGMGTSALWSLYSRYMCVSGLHNNPRVLIKALESFCSRRICDRYLLQMAGDALATAIDTFHPAEVARVSDIYVRSGYHHSGICTALIHSAERIVPSLDPRGAVKLLQIFVQAYGKHSDGSTIPNRHRRALYLTFNRCSTGAGHFDASELLAVTGAMRLLPVSPPSALVGSLQRLLSRAIEPPKDEVMNHPGRMSARQLAEIVLKDARRKRLNITGAEASVISQLAGIDTKHQIV
ncbi:Cysteine desulfurase SufS [Babesia sp. Xinjiang]|uniref:Cysteine desulfurase SufS n=1 Tax=Babesia sp. Xinjiang TaxID=462227 RepID=UPI000A2587F0|nr:Cysteine desulfurase SufS [Babesia sp. Xinjiang]ORM39873.1 Cysteine desulfurase SufS [Babesia sp. Xinjiang]